LKFISISVHYIIQTGPFSKNKNEKKERLFPERATFSCHWASQNQSGWTHRTPPVPEKEFVKTQNV